MSSHRSNSTCRFHWIPIKILDELAVRFVFSLPERERNNPVRVCFQLELAHWFYIDNILPNNPELAEGTIHEFCAHMFNHVPFLRKFTSQVDTILECWMNYKMSVPVNGAIMLNKAGDKVLMVKGYGTNASWTFPKGKINEDEEEHKCAVREVLEETGYDISHLINQDLYLEKVIRYRTVRLFLVSGVDEDFDFQPRVRGEIKEIKWWSINQLPTSYSDKGTKERLGVSPHHFFTAIPFINESRLWADQSINYSDEDVGKSFDVNIRDSGTFEEIDTFIPDSWSNFSLDLSGFEMFSDF